MESAPANLSETKPPGRISLIRGCMFSGKSLLLVQRVQQAREAGRQVAVFKHASDDRYGRSQIVTHNGQRTDAVPVASAGRVTELAGNADIVVIDEAQFFDGEIVNVCRDLASRGCTVIVAGLDRDSWGQPFGPMPALAAAADEITQTRATCARCGRAAEFTQRLTSVTDRTMIGGPESYEPRCEQCFEAPPLALRR
ncbi:MAG TPA: thymidine kinase [Phycisphaerae bacterium]|nr:thymidine kinase [Phycisphaerae bacterium]